MSISPVMDQSSWITQRLQRTRVKGLQNPSISTCTPPRCKNLSHSATCSTTVVRLRPCRRDERSQLVHYLQYYYIHILQPLSLTHTHTHTHTHTRTHTYTHADIHDYSSKMRLLYLNKKKKSCNIWYCPPTITYIARFLMFTPTVWQKWTLKLNVLRQLLR